MTKTTCPRCGAPEATTEAVYRNPFDLMQAEIDRLRSMDKMFAEIVPIQHAIAQERFRQNAQWGGREHDAEHSIAEWSEFIQRQSILACSADFESRSDEVRERFIKIAALAVAAIQAEDYRKEGQK